MPTIISGDGTITGLTATGISAVQNLPAGSVIQVVNAISTTANGTTTSLVDTGLTATITPKFSTSRVVVLVMQNFYAFSGGTDNGVFFSLVRNGTTIYTPPTSTGNSFYIFTSGVTNEFWANYPINYVDSPATTSAVTYKTQMQGNSGSTINAQAGSTPSTIILMEIAA